MQTNKDLLIELVKTNFKLRYNNSFLGFLWVLLKPTFTFIILYIVFSNFKAQNIPHFAIYLLIGIVVYTFFQEGVIYGLNSLLEKAHIILKVNFSKQAAVYSSLLIALINFVINVAVIFLFSVFNPITPNIVSILYFVFISITLFLMVTAFSFISSILLIKLRDLEHIFQLLLQLGFYATPIFYPIEILPQKLQLLSQYNPLFIIIQASRNALIYGQITYIFQMILLLGISIFAFILARVFFNKQVKKVAEYF